MNDTARLVRDTDASALAELFTARASAVGMRVSPTPFADLGPHLAALLGQLKVRAVTTSVAPGAMLSTVEAAVGTAGGVCLPRPAGHSLDGHYAADAGITDVAAAIAETGSLVLVSGPAHSRGTFLVPPVHIAIVLWSQILPDLLDYWPKFDPSAAATVLVTGPSKTADIEGVLVTGIHGPREVQIVLVDDRAALR